MGTISNHLDQLKSSDLWSVILFALYKMHNNPEYSTLSELSFLLDKDSLLNLCEFFGGMTIHIPTINELENTVNALLLYQFVDIEHQDIDIALNYFKDKSINTRAIKSAYLDIKQTLDNYTFSTRGKS